jgi:hypothetical protein
LCLSSHYVMTRQEGLLVDVSSTRPGPASDVERLDSFLRPGRNCWALRPPGPRSERPTMPRSERTLSPSSATSGATCRQHWRRTRSRRRWSPRVAGASASAGGSGGRVARESAVRSAVTAARPGRRRRVHRHAGHTTSPLHRAGAAIDRAGRRGAADTPTREQGPDALLQRVRVLGFLIPLRRRRGPAHAGRNRAGQPLAPRDCPLTLPGNRRGLCPRGGRRCRGADVRDLVHPRATLSDAVATQADRRRRAPAAFGITQRIAFRDLGQPVSV